MIIAVLVISVLNLFGLATVWVAVAKLHARLDQQTRSREPVAVRVG